MQHQMVLLEERLATLADVRAKRAPAVRVTAVMLQQTMLGGETLATTCAEVTLRFLLGGHWQSSDDCRLLVLLLLVLRMVLLLMVLLQLVVLLVARANQVRLLNHLSS